MLSQDVLLTSDTSSHHSVPTITASVREVGAVEYVLGSITHRRVASLFLNPIEMKLLAKAQSSLLAWQTLRSYGEEGHVTITTFSVAIFRTRSRHWNWLLLIL